MVVRCLETLMDGLEDGDVLGEAEMLMGGLWA